MAEKVGKERIDRLIVDRGLAESRHKAQALIMARRVLYNGRVIDKAGTLVRDDGEVTIKEGPRYVSRGGTKLEGALGEDGFAIDVRGLKVLDVGSSTGGFTDCLLKNGALGVTAVDVGRGIIEASLRDDERVRVLEQTNIRYVTTEELPEKFDMAVIDVSFISLRKVLPRVREFIKDGGRVLALIKPQFEVGKGEVGKGGIVRDSGKHRAVVEGLKTFSKEEGFEVNGVMESPIKGAKGNKEFWIYLTREAR